MSNNVVRLEFAQFGHFTKFKVFRSPEPMVPGSMPEPIADNLKTMFFVDTAVPDGDNYYRVEVERDGEFILSEEMFIRVTNEWSPDSILNLAKVRFNPSDATIQEGKVISWKDTLSDLEFIAPTEASKPSVSLGQLVNEPLIHFNGTGNFMRATGPTAGNIFRKSAYASFIGVIGSENASTVNTAILYGGNGSNGSSRFNIGLGDSSGGGFRLSSRRLDGDATVTRKAPFVAGLNLLEFTRDWGGGKSIIQVNGGVPTTFTENTLGETSDTSGQYNTLTLACASAEINNPPAPLFEAMDMGEWYIFSSALELVVKKKLEGYLAHKYSLTENLPDNHPYKWVKPIVAEDNKPYGAFGVVVGDSAYIRFGVAGEYSEVSAYLSASPLPSDLSPTDGTYQGGTALSEVKVNTPLINSPVKVALVNHTQVRDVINRDLEVTFSKSPPTVVGTVAGSFKTAQSTTITPPTEATVGDLMIIGVMTRSVLTVPAGWEVVGHSTSQESPDRYTQHSYTLKKLLVLEDLNKGVTLSQVDSARIFASCLVLRCPDGYLVLDNGVTNNAGQLPPLEIPQVNVINRGVAIVCGSWHYANTGPSEAVFSDGWLSASLASTSDSGNQIRCALGYKTLEVGESTEGNITANVTNETPSTYNAHCFLVG